MLNPKLVSIVIAALLVGAGAARAGGITTPSSVSEVPPSLYADTLPHATSRNVTGAAHPIFPTAAFEHGPAYDSNVQVRRVGPSPSAAGSSTPVFPGSAIEFL